MRNIWYNSWDSNYLHVPTCICVVVSNVSGWSQIIFFSKLVTFLTQKMLLKQSLLVYVIQLGLLSKNLIFFLNHQKSERAGCLVFFDLAFLITTLILQRRQTSWHLTRLSRSKVQRWYDFFARTQLYTKCCDFLKKIILTCFMFFFVY